MIDSNKAEQILQALFDHEVMSDHDLENLSFLLSSSEETLMDWYNQADEEDLHYASTILNIAHNFFSDNATVIDTTQANQILKKYMYD